MSSMISFAWRQRRSAHSSTASSDFVEAEPTSPTPEVLASNSEESLDENFVQITIPRVPQTPEGLRPRPSMSSLHKELKIPISEPTFSPLPNFRRSVLPSMPSSSWSTQGVMSSPPLSTSSFYHGDQIAQSPHLMPGKARTAVGALVALQHFPNLPEENHSSRPTSQELEGVKDGDWENNIKAFSYVALDDQKQCARASYPESDKLTPPLSPTSNSSVHSSVMESPSHLAHPYPLVKSEALMDQGAGSESVSASSRVGLIPQEAREQYDFEPLVSNQMVIASDQTQVSGLGSLYSRVVSEDDADLHHMEEFDQALQNRKSENQARFKQNLIVACVERLQDQVQLVVDIETVNEAGLQYVSRTPLDQEGLLVGFSQENRRTIIRNVNAILNEMEVAAPEEFILSPSQVNVQTHHILRDALFFCRTLVAMAIPLSERQGSNAASVEHQGHWRVLSHLSKALGTNRGPETPQLRGGGTSLFSLPSEDTPMTSNLSVSSTITSHHMNSHVKAPNVNGLYVRQTIQILSNSLQTLSNACLDLCIDDHVTAVHASETIKKVYVKELLQMDASDLKHLIDGFELELPVFTKHGIVLSAGVAPINLYEPSKPSRTDDSESSISGNSHQQETSNDNSRTMCSPNTADMETLESVASSEDEFEDLRRTIGSSDYDDAVEEREGPDTALQDEEDSV